MIEREVYVGSVLQLIVHLATGQTIQAWQQNEGDVEAAGRASGTPVAVHLPREALRVLPEGGTAVVPSGDLADE
jgi:TOBE domain